MIFRSFLKGALALATGLAFATGASAQTAYKAEYKMSLVVGPAFPWGKGGEIWANMVKERTQAASTSSSTPACRWCRVTRRVSSPPSARV